MQIQKIKCFGTDLMRVKFFQVTLLDGIVTNLVNQQGVSNYDDVIQFINNPKNTNNIEYIDIDFLEKKASKLNIRSGFLNGTDKYYIRLQETNIQMPPIIATKRLKAYTETELIKSAQTMEELDSLQLEKDEYFNV